MLYAYVDESGDTGYENSPSKLFTLALLLIPDRKWLDSLNGLVELRRKMRRLWGISQREELKAAHLLRPGGEFRRLSLPLDQRLEIYSRTMRSHR